MLSYIAETLMRLACRSKTGGVVINEHVLDEEQMRRHVETLGRWFDFIHPDNLASSLGRRAPRPFCLLTFDDGHRSNATMAAPVLEKLGVPASFLVVTDFVGTEGVLWFTLYSRLCRKLGAPPPGLSARAIKQLPHDVLLERLQAACREHGIAGDGGDEHCLPMTWDQVRDLARRGFDVGSHGAEHSIMTRQTREEAFANIERGLTRVTQELGRPCRTFAFPNGNYTAELAHHAHACGARLVFTAEPTWADERFPLWRLPRIQLFAEHDRAHMDLKVAVSAAGRFVPSGDGTRLVYSRVNRLAALADAAD